MRIVGLGDDKPKKKYVVIYVEKTMIAKSDLMTLCDASDFHKENGGFLVRKDGR